MIANKAKFSVVLVNYKTPKMTEVCLKLLQQALVQFSADVWVVDNDSADASTELLRKLDWIKLIERKPSKEETGYEAHGLALDLALRQIETEHVFIMHTDTMIYDGEVFRMMLELCSSDASVAAVGCVDQVNRGVLRSCWRILMRFIKYHVRHVKRALGLKSKPPKAYIEHYLRSFFALWNVQSMKRQGLTFSLEGKTPGYAAQDKFEALGYRVKNLPARMIFQYLDHVQGGTKSFGRGSVKHSRLRNSLRLVEKISFENSIVIAR